MSPLLTGMLRPAQITLTYDDGPVRLLQVDEGALPDGRRVLDKVPHVQHFGHAAVPPIGSQAVLAALGAVRSSTVVLGTNHQSSRPRDLEPGDSVLYDVRGARVQLTADGLLIDCAGLAAQLQSCPTLTVTATEKVTIDAPRAELLHDVAIGGALTVAGQASFAEDVTIAGGASVGAALAVTGAATAASLQVDGEVTAGAAKLTVLRDAYAAHHHTGISRGSGTSDGPDKAV